MKGKTMSLLSKLFGGNKLEKVFEMIEFDRSDLDIFVLDMRGLDNPTNYYLTNHNGLKGIKKKWKFEPKNTMGRCWYDYEIFLKDQEKYAAILICFECNSLTFMGSPNETPTLFAIEKEKILQLLEEDFRRLNTVKKTFSSKKEGRDFWTEIRRKNELYIFENKLPKWLKFDGRFSTNFKTHEYIDDKDVEKLSDNEFASQVFADYLKQYSTGDDFSLDCLTFMGATRGHYFYVNCTHELYERVEGLKKDAWKEFEDYSIFLHYKN